MKSNIELKREYWSQPSMYLNPEMVDRLVEKYGDKPASFGEAMYILRYNFLEVLWRGLKKGLRK